MMMLGSRVFLLLFLLIIGCKPSEIIKENPDNKKVIQLKELGRVIKEGGKDTIYIKNGIYSDINIRASYQGNRNKVVMPETPGGVTIKGNSTIIIENTRNFELNGFHFFEIKNRNSIILDNCKRTLVSNNYFTRCGNKETHSILFIENGSSKNTVIRNTFDGSRSLSVVISADPNNSNNKKNKYNIISENLFCNILGVDKIYPGKTNGLEAIQIGQGKGESHLWKLKTKVFNNLFENIVGDYGEIISIKSSSNSIFQNTFLNNESSITIRLGNRVKIYSNYLKRTTKGIRVFGYGHKIHNNYIIEPIYGIQMASADFERGDMKDRPGYFQVKNCEIKNNVIIDPKKEAFRIGNGNRKLLPERVRITGNWIQTNSSERTLDNINNLKKSSITIKNNTIKRSDISASSNQNLLTPIVPYKSLDPSVGAVWKRP